MGYLIPAKGEEGVQSSVPKLPGTSSWQSVPYKQGVKHWWCPGTGIPGLLCLFVLFWERIIKKWQRCLYKPPKPGELWKLKLNQVLWKKLFSPNGWQNQCVTELQLSELSWEAEREPWSFCGTRLRWIFSCQCLLPAAFHCKQNRAILAVPSGSQEWLRNLHSSTQRRCQIHSGRLCGTPAGTTVSQRICVQITASVLSV